MPSKSVYKYSITFILPYIRLSTTSPNHTTKTIVLKMNSTISKLTQNLSILILVSFSIIPKTLFFSITKIVVLKVFISLFLFLLLYINVLDNDPYQGSILFCFHLLKLPFIDRFFFYYC